jgi:glycosyltransferase involved in cell wall biosynthesis
MKILFVHEVSYNSKVVFEMHELPELLAKSGHDVTFVDFPEHDRLWPVRLKNSRAFIPGRSQLDININVISLARIFPYPFDRITCAVRSVVSMYRIMRQVRPDVVILYSVPTNGWQSIIAAKLLRIPVIFRAIDVSHLLRKTVFQSLVKIAEKYVYRRSDLVIANNPVLASYCETNGVPRRRCTYIFPGTTELPADGVTKFANDGWANVVFMGTLFRFSGLEWFLRLVADTPLARRDIRLEIIGDGEDRKNLENLVSDLGLDTNVRFRGRVPFELLRPAMSSAKVGIIPFRESTVTRLALPGKVPQYLQVGLATVSTRLDGLQSLLPEGAGVLYRSKGNEFIEVVLELLEDSSKREKLVEDGMSQIRRCATWPNALSQFEKCIEQVQQTKVS